MNHLSDEELMARCASGDRHAMDVLVSRYHSRLLDFAFRQLGDREASADVAQTALLRVFESAARYRLQASFKTWLYKIALNLIRDAHRRRRVRKESLSSELDEIEPAALREGRPSLEETALGRMAASAVWKAVDGLPESQRSAIILKFREGLTYEEISDVMGAPVGTVKSWIHYGLKALRKSVRCED